MAHKIRVCHGTPLPSKVRTSDRAHYVPERTPQPVRYKVADRGQNGLRGFAERLTTNAFHRWQADGCYDGRLAAPITGSWKGYRPNKEARRKGKVTRIV